LETSNKVRRLRGSAVTLAQLAATTSGKAVCPLARLISAGGSVHLLLFIMKRPVSAL
jgi:hypothetical protein